MTRRRILVFVLLAGSIAVGAGIWLLLPCTAITPENADSIHPGMTLAAVEAILGGPARDEGTGPVAADEIASAELPRLQMRIAAITLGEHRHLEWYSDRVVVVVEFDLEERVSERVSFPVHRTQESPLDMPVSPVPEGFLDRIRRWLRL